MAFDWKQGASHDWHATDRDDQAVTVFRLPVFDRELWSYAYADYSGRIHPSPNHYRTPDEAKAFVEFLCAPETEAA